MERVWITGASSGIGQACAERYAADGAALALTSSSAERLAPVAQRCRELGAAQVAVLPYDFSDPSGIEALTERAWEALGGLDTVLLNAGISQRTTVEDTSDEMIRKIMEVNYFSR